MVRGVTSVEKQIDVDRQKFTHSISFRPLSLIHTECAAINFGMNEYKWYETLLLIINQPSRCYNVPPATLLAVHEQNRVTRSTFKTTETNHLMSYTERVSYKTHCKLFNVYFVHLPGQFLQIRTKWP